ncbi:MAG: LysR family transcriptional regulator [Acidiferrobacterales bacterium]|nr:LysR family transcriptional regulator [Acidiferrobacterales bacterium]
MADRRLQVFATVARLLSFTKAAEALHMTQPAVTFQIRQLEEYFNTRLFDRTHNKITLTETGNLVKSYADQIISKYNEMDNEVRTMTGDIQGPLMIGASTTIGEYFIPGIVGSYQRQYPDVKIRLNVANTNGIIHMVENNEIDIGIVEGPVNNKNLVREVIWHDELVVVCPIDHALTSRKKANMQEVLEFPFISREEGSGTREVLENYMSKRKIDLDEVNIIMEFGSPESIKSAVTAGLGVSILSVATMEKDLALESLAAVPLSPPIKRTFSIVYPRQKFRLRAMEEFLEFARDHCADRNQNRTVNKAK